MTAASVERASDRASAPAARAAAGRKLLGLKRALVRYAAAVALVGVAWACSEAFKQALHTNRLSMIFLAAVLITAVTFGAGPAMVAALLAFALYNFYLVEPRFEIQFVSAEDFFVLALFLLVALMTGGLAGRLRDENERAQARARTLAVLFDASREMSSTEAEARLRERLAGMIASATGGQAWVLAPTKPLDQVGGLGLPDVDTARLRGLLTAAEAGVFRVDTFTEGAWRVRPLSVDGASVGFAVWRTDAEPSAAQGLDQLTSEIDQLTRVLTDLGAAALARARLGAQKAEAEVVARAERLRTALLSSISHDFRTPLSAILASATTLLEYDHKLDVATRRDLTTNIQEEVERLNRFVANLLNMTKLESGVLELKVGPVLVSEVAARTVERLRSRKGLRRITTSRAGEEAPASADPVLFEHVLMNLMENALAFSPDLSEVAITIQVAGPDVRVEVRDEGPGVPPEDLQRIFEKFYRVGDARQAARGSGLGLSIARGLVEAMGGTIQARQRPDGAQGLSVVVSLPVAA